MSKGGPVYPPVVGEFETVRKLCKGFSIGRIGDGDLKAMEKGIYTRELVPVPALSEEMKEFARNPHPMCLIGIPTMDPAGTKYENWQRHKERFQKYFNSSTGITYYSALITRPDCGPWMETREYYEAVIKIWARKKRVAILSESASKLLTCLRETHEVIHVECPMFGSFAHINRFEKALVAAKPDIALLSCGPTATVLANRLTVHGIQAIDIGSIGGFIARWRGGGPKTESYADERTNP